MEKPSWLRVGQKVWLHSYPWSPNCLDGNVGVIQEVFNDSYNETFGWEFQAGGVLWKSASCAPADGEHDGVINALITRDLEIENI